MSLITTTAYVLLFTAAAICGLEIIYQVAGKYFLLQIISPYMVLAGLMLLEFLLYVDAEG